MTEKKPPKVRLERINPTQIVEVWKLYDRSLKEGNQPYPDISEDQPEVMRAHLFQYLHHRNTVGVLAKIGKRTVGMILGDVQARPYGRPHVYCYVWVVWVEPEFRKRGVMELMYKDFFSKLKKAGVHYWEANSHDHLTKVLTGYPKYETRKLYDRIGGKC